MITEECGARKVQRVDKATCCELTTALTAVLVFFLSLRKIGALDLTIPQYHLAIAVSLILFFVWACMGQLLAINLRLKQRGTGGDAPASAPAPAEPHRVGKG